MFLQCATLVCNFCDAVSFYKWNNYINFNIKGHGLFWTWLVCAGTCSLIGKFDTSSERAVAISTTDGSNHCFHTRTDFGMVSTRENQLSCEQHPSKNAAHIEAWQTVFSRTTDQTFTDYISWAVFTYNLQFLNVLEKFTTFAQYFFFYSKLLSKISTMSVQ